MSSIPPSQKQQFDKARAFIEKKDYARARRALAPIADNPTAQKWIAKIDELDPPLVGKAARGASFLFPVVMLIVGIVIGAVGVFALTGGGKVETVEVTVYPPEVAAFATWVSEPSQTPNPTETPAPENTPAPGSSRETAFGANETVQTQRGSYRVTEVQWPTWYSIYEEEGAGIADVPALPIEGADFVSIEIDFTCPPTESECDLIALMDLILEDGRIVESSDFLALGAQHYDEIIGGASTVGTETYQIPLDSKPAMLRIRGAFDNGDAYIELPPSVDGFAIEQDWIADDDGETKENPVLRRALALAGVDALSVNYKAKGNEIDLSILVRTDELLYSEENDMWMDASFTDAIGVIADSWAQHEGGASTVYITTASTLDEIVGIGITDAECMDRYDGRPQTCWEIIIP